MGRDENLIKIGLKYDLKFDLVTINSAFTLILVSIKNIFLYPTFCNIKITVTLPIDLSYITILAHLIGERIKAYGDFSHTFLEK